MCSRTWWPGRAPAHWRGPPPTARPGGTPDENETIEKWMLNPGLENNKGAHEAIEKWTLNPGLETDKGENEAIEHGCLTPGSRPARASRAKQLRHTGQLAQRQLRGRRPPDGEAKPPTTA